MEIIFRTKLRVNPVKSEGNDYEGLVVRVEAENGVKTIDLAFLATSCI